MFVSYIIMEAKTVWTTFVEICICFLFCGDTLKALSVAEIMSEHVLAKVISSEKKQALR